jgi:hypothetical protein
MYLNNFNAHLLNSFTLNCERILSNICYVSLNCSTVYIHLISWELILLVDILEDLSFKSNILCCIVHTNMLYKLKSAVSRHSKCLYINFTNHVLCSSVFFYIFQKIFIFCAFSIESIFMLVAVFIRILGIFFWSFENQYI